MLNALAIGSTPAETPTWISIDLGSTLFDVGLLGFATVFIVCLTCLALGLPKGGAKRLKAFARVLRSLRRKP